MVPVEVMGPWMPHRNRKYGLPLRGLNRLELYKCSFWGQLLGLLLDWCPTQVVCLLYSPLKDKWRFIACRSVVDISEILHSYLLNINFEEPGIISSENCETVGGKCRRISFWRIHGLQSYSLNNNGDSTTATLIGFLRYMIPGSQQLIGHCLILMLQIHSFFWLLEVLRRGYRLMDLLQFPAEADGRGTALPQLRSKSVCEKWKF